jgi:hypothetical protein
MIRLRVRAEIDADIAITTPLERVAPVTEPLEPR